MARLLPLPPALLLSASTLGPVLSVTNAGALLPPDQSDEPAGTGGSEGVAEPPLAVYLNRFTYYVGEVITGYLDCPSCYPEGPLFTDQMGMVLSGTVVYDEINLGSFFFIPNEPLPVGYYSVELNYFTTSFEVVEGPALSPTYQVNLVEDPQPVGEPLTCQSYVPGFETYAYPQTRVDAALALSIEGESSDQYRYEFALNAEATRTSTTAGFPLARFREGDGEFCVEVFALPYSGDSEFSLGTTCMNPDEELDLGVKDLPYGTVESVLRVCELPPDGYTEDWCAYHTEAFTRHSCQGFIEEACVLARYECPEGDLPEWYNENGIDPEDPNAPYDPITGSGGTGGGGTGGADTGENGTGAAATGATGSGASGGEGGLSRTSNESGDADADASEDVGGCSCRTSAFHSSGSDGRSLILLGLGGALIALRRRERRLSM